ncbi:MAG: IS30 family transposase [Paraglaciecola sp.]|jgi:IS30 family transposase
MHSCERGLNENHNGLIRQYLPKSMALDKVTSEDMQMNQAKLNNRARKQLCYKTPNEIYDAIRLAA